MASLFKPINKSKAHLSAIKLKETRKGLNQENLKQLERELFQGVGNTPNPSSDDL